MKRTLVALALVSMMGATGIPTMPAGAAPAHGGGTGGSGVTTGRGGGQSMAGAAAPTQAVAALVQNYVYYRTPRQRLASIAGPQFRACNPAQVKTGGARACPVTPRLAYRLNHPDQPANGCPGGCTLEPISRAQNVAIRILIAQRDANAWVAHVDTRWVYGQDAYTITVTVVRRPVGWQVDDLFCAGRPGTTLYKRIVPCI